MATLTQVRTGLKTTVDSVTTAQRYRFQPKNPQFPCIVVGLPDEFDTRATETGQRTMLIPVWCGAEGNDDESTDDAIHSLVEATVAALLAAPTLGGVVESIDVQPATSFSATVTADNRVTVWCSLPIEVFA
jgi:hypothetical protein